MNRNLFFKIGIILFGYTIIIGFHLKENTYYKIKESPEIIRLLDIEKRFNSTILSFKPNEYVPQEKYFLSLQSNALSVQLTILKQTEKKYYPLKQV